jgi:hypothetical protein
VPAADQQRNASRLVDRHRRTDLEHLAAAMGREPCSVRIALDLIDRCAGGLLIGGSTPVEGDHRALVLDPHAQPLNRSRVGGERE